MFKKPKNLLTIYIVICIVGLFVNLLFKYIKDEKKAKSLEISEIAYSRKQAEIKYQLLDTTPNLIESRIQRRSVPVSNLYYIDFDKRLLSLKFQDIIYNGTKLKFQYSLSPKEYIDDFGDENWFHIQLPKGNNTIYIRAIDTSRMLATQFHTIKIIEKSKKINLFIISCIVWVLLFFPLTYFAYKRKAKEKQLESDKKLALEQQRQKITADLHDDIGASLSSLQINSAIALKLISKEDIKTRNILAKIETQASEIISRMGDFIWSMNSDEDSLMSLSSRIKNYANEIFGNSDVEYKIEINNQVDELIQDNLFRKNIVLITKEAINNAAKYSKAKFVLISIQVVEKMLIINVSDNGTGFEHDNKNGNGLINMKKRTKELNGIFQIISTKNEGTQIEAKIPIPRFNDKSSI